MAKKKVVRSIFKSDADLQKFVDAGAQYLRDTIDGKNKSPEYKRGKRIMQALIETGKSK